MIDWNYIGKTLWWVCATIAIVATALVAYYGIWTNRI
jgi:hypothetical protein